MSAPAKQPFRLRITSKQLNTVLDEGNTYLVRRGRTEVAYIGADEMERSLSDLVGSEAAELRFALEDAKDGEDAAKAVRTTLDRLWSATDPNKPTVQVLP